MRMLLLEVAFELASAQQHEKTKWAGSGQCTCTEMGWYHVLTLPLLLPLLHCRWS